MIETVLGTGAFVGIFVVLLVKALNLHSGLTAKGGEPRMKILGIVTTTALLVIMWTIFFVTAASSLHFSETHESVTGSTTTTTTITNTNYFAYFNLLNLTNLLLLLGFGASFIEGFLWLRWNWQKNFY